MTNATRQGRPKDMFVPVVKDWLQFVGAEHNIEAEEVHHRFRPASTLKPVRDHFVFWFASSGQEMNSRSGDKSTKSGNDSIVSLYKTYMRTLVVQCMSEDGMAILESLWASDEHPGVVDVLSSGDCGLALVGLGGIEDITEQTETRVDWGYEARFSVRVNGEFTKTRTDHVVDTITISGELINDEGGTIDLDVTAPPA